jgi:hypothetical protein
MSSGQRGGAAAYEEECLDALFAALRLPSGALELDASAVLDDEGKSLETADGDSFNFVRYLSELEDIVLHLSTEDDLPEDLLLPSRESSEGFSGRPDINDPESGEVVSASVSAAAAATETLPTSPQSRQIAPLQTTFGVGSFLPFIANATARPDMQRTSAVAPRRVVDQKKRRIRKM